MELKYAIKKIWKKYEIKNNKNYKYKVKIISYDTKEILDKAKIRF